MGNIEFTKFDPLVGRSVPLFSGGSIYEQYSAFGPTNRKKKKGPKPDEAMGNFVQDYMNKMGIPGSMSKADRKSFGSDILSAMGQGTPGGAQARPQMPQAPAGGQRRPQMPQAPAGGQRRPQMPQAPDGAQARPQMPKMPGGPQMPGGDLGQGAKTPVGFDLPQIAASRNKAPAGGQGRPQMPQAPAGAQGRPQMPQMPQAPAGGQGRPQMPGGPQMPAGAQARPQMPQAPAGGQRRPQMPQAPAGGQARPQMPQMPQAPAGAQRRPQMPGGPQMPAGGPRPQMPAGPGAGAQRPQMPQMPMGLGAGGQQKPEEVELWDAYSGKKQKFIKGDPANGVNGVRGRKDITKDEASGYMMALGQWRTQQPSGGVNPNEYVMAYGVVPEKVRGLSPQELPATQEMEELQQKQAQTVQQLGGDGKDGPEWFTHDPKNQGAPVETPEGMGGVVDDIQKIYAMQQELGGNIGDMVKNMQQERQAAQQGGMPGMPMGPGAPMQLAAGAAPQARPQMPAGAQRPQMPMGPGAGAQARPQMPAGAQRPQMPMGPGAGAQRPQMPMGPGAGAQRPQMPMGPGAGAQRPQMPMGPGFGKEKRKRIPIQ